MTSSDQEKQTEPHLPPSTRDDLSRLRSASPAIKRPASDMGAQDREEHKGDVEMVNSSTPSFLITSEPQTSDLKAKQQDTGKTHSLREDDVDTPHASHPGAVQQDAPSDSTANSVADSSLQPSSTSTVSSSIISPEVPPTCTDLPSFDEQDEKVRTLCERQRTEGQKGFVVSSRWWNRVQARRSHTDAKTDKAAAEGDVGLLDNANLAMVTEDSGKLVDLAGDKFVILRPGLRYEEDYIIVPQEAWDLLLSWYGLAKDSPVITRYSYDISSEDEDTKVEYELEPPIFSLLKVASETTQQTQKEVHDSPPKMVASKYMSANDWLKRAKQLLHIDLKTKVRVWRILGGLKSHAPSGLPSPAASRSSSPAPGTEMVATVPEKMLLDVNDFAVLSTGEHREDLNIDDNTANDKYNGKSKLGIYTGRSELIALEEQKKNGDWPSESARLALPKTLRDKQKNNLTASGRTSPSPGVTTRGRSRKEGKGRGNVGLTNLGNTCYMNSALQSIKSVEELTEYFLQGKWKNELNTSNPLGYHGNVAKAYAGLMKNLFEGGNASAFTPREFKNTVGRYNHSFAGYGQQDSQELLLFLLDGMSEDLNRIAKKPYIEKPDSTDEMVNDRQALKEFADRNWSDYKARNDSIVTDLFAGMYKSTLTCPNCNKVSIIFDPFSNLTLQLPIENTWSKQCFFLPLNRRLQKLEIEVDKHASIQELKAFVEARTRVPTNRLVVAEGYKNKFYKIFDNPIIISEANIHVQNDIIFVIEVEDVPTNYNPDKRQKYSMFGTNSQSDDVVDPDSPGADKMLVPVFHRLVKNPNDSKRLSQRPFFGYASFIVLDREDNKTYDGVLRKVLGNVGAMTTRKIFEEASDDDSSDVVDVADDSSRSGTNTNEDGYVDVGMRDASTAPESSPSPNAAFDRFLKSSKPIPQALSSLFDICVKATGEGIPTGWNQISEHDDFTNIRTRVRKPPPARSSVSSEEGDESEASEDLEDMHRDASTPESDGASDASQNAPMASTEEDDTAAMFDNFKARNRNKHTKQKVYRRKGKTIQGKRTQQREPTRVRQQPTPPDTDMEMLVRPGECVVLDWTLDGHDALFGNDHIGGDDGDARGAKTWSADIPVIEDEALQTKRQARAARKKNGVTLEECLDEFGKAEVLSEQNMWYCPNCKEFRRAEKKFELWKAPDILVMHLKRFSSQRNFRDKLELFVEYPLEGLDITKYVQDPEEGKTLVYDLIAVDNHYGGLGGGHYTAYAKNFNNGDWYEYNDSHVGRREPQQVVTSSAYILFYRRRSDHLPLGGPKVEEMLGPASGSADSDEGPSRDPSPGAGEGRRLDDSSRNGLSGLGAVGAAHQLGVGGLGNLSQDQSVDNGTHSTTIQEIEDEGYEEGLPPYASTAWDNTPGWGFDVLSQSQPPPNSDVEMFGETGSQDSTRAAGHGSQPDDDSPMFSDAPNMGPEDESDRRTRGIRESAPPPDFVVATPADDEEEDLPVMELRPGDGEDMDVSYADK